MRCEDEWRLLVAERFAARERWASAAEVLAVRSRDPFGIRRFVREHPGVASGVCAGVGALVVKSLLGSARGSTGKRADEEEPGTEPAGASPWMSALRQAALGIAVPWITGAVTGRSGHERGGNGSGDTR